MIAVGSSIGGAVTFPDDEARWNAVVHRDRNADGVFYYSVKTTGVYCRPSCGSRLARRENVGFHSCCEDAERAGFRACKRCRPNEQGLGEQRAAAVLTACRTIEQGAEAPDLTALAQAAGMSRFHFHRIFKAVTGLTPKGYAKAHRTRRVREELTRSDTVTKAIYGAGYQSNGHFYATSSTMLGMTPTDFRSGGQGTRIRFAVGESSLGAVLLGDDPEALVRDLQDRFPNARLSGGERDFEQWVAKVVGFVDSPKLGLDLPLDVRGTAFQQRVWQALRDIPCGETASYTEVARRIGAPKAVRAVAQACAANPIAVAIPCHRVVRTDGSLSGYRWGIDRKASLLEREREKG
jgi:AraC family transcriptional regulator of adaptative response/methylated-DNA-[protein]-cysteine methyltransferase